MGVFDGLVSSISASAFLLLILVLYRLSTGSGSAEGDALNAFKTQLSDPNSVLESWDPTLVNPCTWFNVTCNNQNTVIRVDLGNALLSGQLVPQLGQLVNLQYLELYSNNISGSIPAELGNLTSLVSLDLYLNNLSGTIPSTLGNLQKLRSLRLSNNKLTGTIPMALTTISTLQVIDLSNNRLTGVLPRNGSFSLFTPISFAGNMFEAPAPAPSKSPCPGSTSMKAADCNTCAEIDHGVVGLLSLAAAFIFIHEWYGYQWSSCLILHNAF